LEDYNSKYPELTPREVITNLVKDKLAAEEKENEKKEDL